MEYKTKHKEELILFLQNNSDRHLTISDISDALPNIPLATLYRLIDNLLENGKVRKFIIDINQGACYQYVDDNACHDHFHFICQKCGKLYHLDCDEINLLLKHLEKDHGFALDLSKVNLYGLCKDCNK